MQVAGVGVGVGVITTGGGVGVGVISPVAARFLNSKLPVLKAIIVNGKAIRKATKIPIVDQRRYWEGISSKFRLISSNLFFKDVSIALNLGYTSAKLYVKRNMSRLTTVALFFLPLFFWPNPPKYELAKIILFLLLSFLLAVWFLLKNKLNRLDNKIWFLWVLFLFLSTLFNNRLLPGLVGDGYRHQGIIFFLTLGIWTSAFGLVPKTNQEKIWWWVGLAAIIESLVILSQWLAINLHFPILTYNDRPLGTFGEPNAAAGFLVMGLPILANVFPPSLVFLAIGAIILTGSKTGLLALLAQGLIFSSLKLKSFPGKKFFAILGLVIILFIGIFGVWQERNQSLFENRWLIWNLGTKAVFEKPILGYGAEGIITVYDKQYQNIDRPLVELAIDRAHNFFLDIILLSGFIGLIIFLKWFWENTRKIKEDWRTISLVGFLIFSFFQPIGVVHWIYLIFLLSIKHQTDNFQYS